MATKFPTGPSNGQAVIIDGKQYVWDGIRWELSALLDTFTNELPVVKTQSTQQGVGRSIDHSFTIERLDDLETL